MRQVNSLDFLKVFFMFGMVARHFPLYFFPPGSVEEYSLTPVSLYSLFIPVTSSFIALIAIGFSFSERVSLDRYLSRLKKAGSIVVLMLFMDISWELLRGGAINIEYISRFFDYKWNTAGKPGFYILLPIAYLYVLSVVQLLSKKYRMLIHAAVIVFCWIYMDLYAFHYLFIGWAIFIACYEFRLFIRLEAVGFVALTLLSMVCLILYALIYLGHFIRADVLIELVLFILLVPPIVQISSILKVWLHERVLTQIKRIAGLVLPFYLIHVTIFNLTGHFWRLTSSVVTDLMTFVIFFSIALTIDRGALLLDRFHSRIGGRYDKKR